MHKIAMIEDQESVREQVTSILGDMCEITSFDSAKDFHLFIGEKTDTFDLVLTDLYLPGEDGRDVLNAMMVDGTPIIIVTGDQDVKTESEMLSLGAFDYIRKPLNEEILRHRVGLHLKLREEKNRVKQTQEQLVQSEKLAALGQLAAGVAHEINNPIGFVTSNSNLVKKYVQKISSSIDALESELARESTGNTTSLFSDWKSKSKIESFLKDLSELSEESIEGLDRVKNIVKDLKDYAYVKEEEFEFADLNKCITSTVNLLRNEIKYKAEVVLALGEIPPLPCLASQLNQVFVNILVNACHAIPKFGNLGIETLVDGGCALIRITDDGIGMSNDLIGKIFDPFYTTKTIGQGTGIGLAISKTIVERHLGRISVVSEVGVGTTFEVRIPLKHQAS